MANPKPVSAALRSRCGVCNEGKVFKSKMQFKDKCDVCGQDFSMADTADGPAYFVGFGLLILIMPFAVLIPLSDLPLLGKLFGYVILLGVVGALIWYVLPIVKALFLNLQIFDKSGHPKFK